jgi:hypothetical protein
MPRHDISRPWELQLELETAKGTRIENSQSSEPIPDAMIRGFETRFRGRFPRIVERTARSTGAYNCHGMVFAARRTQIYEAHLIRMILDEDGYKEIPVTEALPGDVALYVSDLGQIDHSAIVIEGPDINALLKMPKVFSKWGTWVEVIHWANDCPWAQEAGTTIKYYRVV